MIPRLGILRCTRGETFLVLMDSISGKGAVSGVKPASRRPLNGHDLTRTGGRGAFPMPSAHSAAKPEKCPSRLSAGAATQAA